MEILWKLVSGRVSTGRPRVVHGEAQRPTRNAADDGPDLGMPLPSVEDAKPRPERVALLERTIPNEELNVFQKAYRFGLSNPQLSAVIS